MHTHTHKKKKALQRKKRKRIVERRKESFALDINGLIEKSFLGLLETATTKKRTQGQLRRKESFPSYTDSSS